jgi:UDP-N-acetylmuramoyl-L-alanyl-D-glutamate--2,6-diaminopimelate ligase
MKNHLRFPEVSMNQYKLSDLLHGIPHEVLQGSINCFVSDVVIDFRKVVHNAFLVSRRGLNVDGHRYIMEASDAGAAAFLVEDKTAVFPAGKPVIFVESTRKVMGLLAANLYGHPSRHMRLVGITGTNGKTTTSYYVEGLLRHAGRKTGLIGTNGIEVNGVPLDMTFTTASTPDPLELHQIFAEMLKMGVQDVVMEVSSHALALHKMEGLTFDVGVFTNLTQDHLDFHGTMDNYRLAKAQLFTLCRQAVMNIDDPSTPVMIKHLGGKPYLTYSLKTDAHLRALHTLTTASGMTFDLETDGTLLYFTLPMLGRFNVYNCLAAIGVVRLLGVNDWETIREGVTKLTHIPGRVQAVPNNKGVFVIVDYAHSPDGLEYIIRTVREMNPQRIVTLFGCGGNRDKGKRPQMGRIAGELSDYVIITSDNPRSEDPMEIIGQIEDGINETPTLYEIIENRKDAITAGVTLLKKGDALIIAGKGHEDYQIYGTTKYHFSDYEVAMEVLCS